MRVRQAFAFVGWVTTLSTALGAAIAASSASIIYMQAGAYGLRQFGRWWWWDYLSVRTPGSADKMVNSFLIGVAMFGVVMLFAWLIAWRLRKNLFFCSDEETLRMRE